MALPTIKEVLTRIMRRVWPDNEFLLRFVSLIMTFMFASDKKTKAMQFVVFSDKGNLIHLKVLGYSQGKIRIGNQGAVFIVICRIWPVIECLRWFFAYLVVLKFGAELTRLRMSEA